MLFNGGFQLKIFIVHAHHETKSFNSAMKDIAVRWFEEHGHLVKVSNLYEMNFKALADANDFTARKNSDYLKYQLEQVNAAESAQFVDDIQSEQEKVQWADMLIFQFPLWWFSLPAVLKGWVDRVFAMGFAYGGGRVYDTGVFRGKRAMLSLTTGGPEPSYGENGRNGSIDKILFHIEHGMLYFTGFDVLPRYVVWAPVRMSDDERKHALDDFVQHLANIESLKPMSF